MSIGLSMVPGMSGHPVIPRRTATVDHERAWNGAVRVGQGDEDGITPALEIAPLSSEHRDILGMTNGRKTARDWGLPILRG